MHSGAAVQVYEVALKLPSSDVASGFRFRILQNYYKESFAGFYNAYYKGHYQGHYHPRGFVASAEFWLWGLKRQKDGICPQFRVQETINLN